MRPPSRSIATGTGTAAISCEGTSVNRVTLTFIGLPLRRTATRPATVISAAPPTRANGTQFDRAVATGGDFDKLSAIHCNSSLMSAADCQRSTGFLERQSPTRWSKAGGTSGRIVETSAGAADIIDAITPG